MSAPVVLDLETVPTEAALREPYPEADRPFPSNYKDPEKIAAWRERDRATWESERVKECSLNPRLGRVLCIGWTMDDATPGVFVAESEAEEQGILRAFWDLMSNADGRVVTFNGRTFDLRWLVLRSLALKIVPSVSSITIGQWFAKYRYNLPHTDVRDLLTNWDERMSGTLEDWCRFVGVPYENGHTGADVYELYRAGKFTEIAAKCSGDVKATKELYQRVGSMFCEAVA